MIHEYTISGFPFRPDIHLRIDHPPGEAPCLWCNRTGQGASMGGPLMCGACDCGTDYLTGKRKTKDVADQHVANYRANVERYRVDL